MARAPPSVARAAKKMLSETTPSQFTRENAPPLPLAVFCEKDPSEIVSDDTSLNAPTAPFPASTRLNCADT